MYCVVHRWWAYKVLSRIPKEEHEEVMLKAAAYDCLGGKRKNWGLQTRWHGNYLARVGMQHCFVAFGKDAKYTISVAKSIEATSITDNSHLSRAATPAKQKHVAGAINAQEVTNLKSTKNVGSEIFHVMIIEIHLLP